MCDYRIHQECEDGIEKSISRMTDGYHEACPVITTGDHERPIFLFHPHKNNDFLFLLTIQYGIFIFKKTHRSSRIRWCATNNILTSL